MWILGFLLAVFVAVTFLMPWFQRASINALRTDVESLMKRIKDLESGVAHKRQEEVRAIPISSQSVVEAASPIREIYPVKESASDGFSLFPWLRDNWLLVIGAIFMIFAAGWLIRYSILHSLIGPVGRVISGLIFGIGIMGIAQYRIRTHLHQGSIFTVLGSVIILLTIFGAQKFYNMFTPAIAMMFMLMTIGLTAFISVRYNAKRLSYAGVLMAGIVPILVSTGRHDFVGLFSYLAVITAGTLWVVFWTGWRKNILLTLSLISFYSLPVLDSYYTWQQEPWIGLAYAFGFATVFFFTSLIASLKVVTQEKMSDLATAGLLGIFIIAWIVRVVPDEWQCLWLIAWMMLFSSASYWLYSRVFNLQFFYVYSGVSALLLVAATAVQFSGPIMTIAFIVEAGILPLITWKILGDVRKTANTTLLSIFPFLLSVGSLAYSRWPEGVVFHLHFFVVLMTAMLFAGLAYFLSEIKKRSAVPVAGIEAITIGAIGIATYYTGHLVWRTLHAALPNDDLAIALSLFLFMITGIASYFMGHSRQMKLLRIYGGLIIGWVSFRLIFIDMPHMAIGGKVATFFILGILLLGTAFLERRKKGDAK